ncbi:MAG: hypothetical protein EON96_20970 [Caulobacteraceae bacterium]|nr:MAG: hypothetical protein EON96_20970 [Caulobacteraceae bacterium]
MTPDQQETERLRERIAALEARRPSVALTTLKVVGTLIALVVVVGGGLAIFGAANPPKTFSERLQIWETQIQAQCDIKWTGSQKAHDDCVVHERQTRPLPPKY